ncbi:hypothetical protein B0H17DRAFT_1137520 [Mycena rosella]|uniref:Uncharacterized protein n=1 Tax=Mycena rosella TaxID=1033263 RepID=A0AAD7GFF6_MYCRO|nr:hypothetical protein B0H17DRAFT_1137520 [Mycena rosella]
MVYRGGGSGKLRYQGLGHGVHRVRLARPYLCIIVVNATVVEDKDTVFLGPFIHDWELVNGTYNNLHKRSWMFYRHAFPPGPVHIWELRLFQLWLRRQTAVHFPPLCFLKGKDLFGNGILGSLLLSDPAMPRNAKRAYMRGPALRRQEGWRVDGPEWCVYGPPLARPMGPARTPRIEYNCYVLAGADKGPTRHSVSRSTRPGPCRVGGRDARVANRPTRYRERRETQAEVLKLEWKD